MTVAQRHNPAPRAFTLVEIIVVLIIIGIVAGVVVPRFVGNSLRAALVESQSVQRFLSTAAEKSVLSGQAVTISYNSNTKRFSLLAMRPTVASPTTSAADSAVANDSAAWRPDPLVDPVELSLNTLKQVLVDGRKMPSGQWQVPFIPGQARPDIRIVLQPLSAPAGSEINVALTPEATSATRTGFGIIQPAGTGPRVVDLDDSGRGDRSW